MLQELAARTGASAWVIGSMLLFLGVWLVIAVRVLVARSDDMDARARLALEGDGLQDRQRPKLTRVESSLPRAASLESQAGRKPQAASRKPL